MSEYIQVIERRFGLMPARFTRFNQRSKVIQVDAVEGCWTEMGHLQGREEVFYHFRVRCGEDRYYLSENVNSGIWTMRAESKIAENN